jgi:hypothetical protein
MTFVRRQILHFAAGALALPATARFGIGQPTSGVGAAADLAAIARDMYLFTFPLYQFYRTRITLMSSANPPQAINALWHFRALLDHTFRTATNPNNDTLYSSAFLDLSRGPLILEVPEIGDRYYTLQFLDSYADSFAYIGTRTTGSAGESTLFLDSGGKIRCRREHR